MQQQFTAAALKPIIGVAKAAGEAMFRTFRANIDE